MTRRSFLKKTTLTAAAVTILSSGSALALLSHSAFKEEDCDGPLAYGKHDTYRETYEITGTTYERWVCEDCELHSEGTVVP